jgi:uroporphyrinogen decarboxylase
MPDIRSIPGLFQCYGVNTEHELKLAVGDDFYAVEVPYKSETSSAIYAAFDWYGKGGVDAHDRTLTADGCFKDCEDVGDLSFFSWPDPKEYISVQECKNRFAMCPDDKAVLGIFWAAHFQDACASFGMETAFMNMLTNPDIYEAVDEKIVDFYLQAGEIFFTAAQGRLDAVLIGNDMGSQRGLMLSPELIRRFILPGCRKLVAQAHRYGIKVIYHSCGSIVDIIPDLVEAGVDVIHPIQALAEGMSAENLHSLYGGKVSFCGGVDTQKLLVQGSEEDVATRVREFRKLFPTGLIISPSHEAIQPDVPPKNIQALFREATKV